MQNKKITKKSIEEEPKEIGYIMLSIYLFVISIPAITALLILKINHQNPILNKFLILSIIILIISIIFYRIGIIQLQTLIFREDIFKGRILNKITQIIIYPHKIK